MQSFKHQREHLVQPFIFTSKETQVLTKPQGSLVAGMAGNQLPLSHAPGSMLLKGNWSVTEYSTL